MSAGHGHGHGHAEQNRRRLAGALAITSAVLVAEAVGAWVSGSLALLADAGHVLTDVAGLVIALIAATLATRPASPRRTWGYRRAEVLAATLQAAALLAVGTFVLVEGVQRLVEPPQVSSTAMLVFGAVGLLGNLAALALLLRGEGAGNVNVRAAVLEVVNDALGSVAVLVAAAVIALTGWTRADAVVSVLIGLLIVPRTLKLLRETTGVLLEAAPPGLDLDDVRRHLLELPHVRAVHDLHASQITSGLPVLSAHVVLDDTCFHDGHAPAILDQLQACLAEHFPIAVEHSTFQLEPVGHGGHETATHD
ncbi:cation diffusion facilitator family transporter [Paenibacillus sp. TRM 82003]|uniref:cation diffusion facilitator family transporter n=1 Tax=Kineococcus sp. TRM81007 TaxID=2925831 RepID=UPI001F5AD9CF|nr:cation diffusion facilitator family transporter [Kineococcus sp. TRM81007]MCI2237432.1 cation diffusion facilitator family transporter [Kineococcus sp. TRM81007]MCI3919784.1 cation diffusion facilitator family transporter [Paenibacillus sp. TRM 82003]